MIGVGSAAAGNEGPKGPPDPQTTNIPYVAWIGETLKVSKCFGFAPGETAASATSALGGSSLLPAGTATVTDWSGVDEAHAGPAVISQPWAQITTAGICFSFDIESDKPGLADVLLSLNNNFLTLILGADSLDQHRYKLIWLQDQAPVIDEVAGDNLGDPTGNGVFNPIPGTEGNSFEPGLVHILVKGTFPLGNDFAGLGHPVVTLPDDWGWLASQFAVDNSPIGSSNGGAAASRWDIHDDDLATEGHTDGSFCLSTGASVDAVDNCQGAGDPSDPDLGPFSNIYGGSDDYAIGPFDPIRPADTFLPDGKVDAGDAPMPALRVDVSLSSDSTVGTLSKADKSDIYIRPDSAPGDPHALYAPFYKAFIPAALPGEGNIIDGGPTTSGVAGHAANNNASFLGFTDPSKIWTTEAAPGLYDYWDTFTLVYSHGYNDCKDALGNWIPMPTGATSVAVYTDEHGEAFVQYNPYPGIKLTPDNDGRCDIYDPTHPTSGTSTITANSVYPDSIPNWDAAPKPSNPLTKTVNYASSKILNCVPKSTDEAFCVETILDPQGNPVEGAKVEFSAQSFTGSEPLIRASAHVVGTYDTTQQGHDTSDVNNRVDVKTGPNGEAAIDVVSTTGSCIDVVAENVYTRNGGTGIFRSVDFNPTSGAACGGTTPPPAGTPSGSNGSSSNSGGTPAGSGTATAPVVTAAPVAVSTPVPTARTAPQAATKTMSLASARVVKVKVGKHSTARYLMVRVNGAAKTAKLKITLVSKHGRSVVTRYVATNRQVRVKNLKLAPTIRSVRVALA